MCVFGLLGFRSGMTRDQLTWDKSFNIYDQILGKYGITEKEGRDTLLICKHNGFTINTPLWGLYRLNDEGMLFEEIADVLDKTADSL